MIYKLRGNRRRPKSAYVKDLKNYNKKQEWETRYRKMKKQKKYKRKKKNRKKSENLYTVGAFKIKPLINI